MPSSSFTLSSGAKIPKIGLGTWKIAPHLLENLIPEAIKLGYRHFDCALDYGNEAEVGKGIQNALSQGLCRREDLWITSKLWNTDHHPDHVRNACTNALKRLQLDYLDLYHIHFPIALEHVPLSVRNPPGWADPNSTPPRMKPVEIPQTETWQAMETLHQEGLTRELGVCNFSSALLHELLATATIRPTVLQVELHPHLTQHRLLKLAQQQNIHVTAFSPFGALSYQEIGMATDAPSLLKNPLIQAIAQAHQATSAQILLAWALARNTSVIPKTSTPQFLQENLQAQNLTLTSSQVTQINQLNQNQRYNDPGEFTEPAFHHYYPIFD